MIPFSSIVRLAHCDHLFIALQYTFSTNQCRTRVVCSADGARESVVLVQIGEGLALFSCWP